LWIEGEHPSDLIGEEALGVGTDSGGGGRKAFNARPAGARPAAEEWGRCVIRLKRIHNFLCSMLVFTPFA
jgi:hypothetical protein